MSDCPSAEEYIVLCLEALQNFKQGDTIASNQIASFLYEPDCRLAQHFEKLKNYIDLPRPTPQTVSRCRLFIRGNNVSCL